jgi:hypothetical protein
VLESTRSPSLSEVYDDALRHDQQWFVEARTGRRSLGTIAPAAILGVTYRERAEFGKWDYRLRFRDDGGAEYNLSVTDLSFRYHLDHLRDERPARARGRIPCHSVAPRRGSRLSSRRPDPPIWSRAAVLLRPSHRGLWLSRLPGREVPRQLPPATAHRAAARCAFLNSMACSRRIERAASGLQSPQAPSPMRTRFKLMSRPGVSFHARSLPRAHRRR